MNFFKMFRRKTSREVRPLRIEGCTVPMTPKPDDAELAAQALLESMADGRRGRGGHHPAAVRRQATDGVKGAAYYRDLRERIRESRAAEKRLALRYLAYCEQELAQIENGKLKIENDGDSENNHPSSIVNYQLLERGLYEQQEVAEREGGELLARWRHCLVDVIVRKTNLIENADDKYNQTTDLTD